MVEKFLLMSHNPKITSLAIGVNDVLHEFICVHLISPFVYYLQFA